MLIEITVKVPSARLSQNARAHHMALYRARKAAREEAWAAARVAWSLFRERDKGLPYAPKFKRVSIRYCVAWPSTRRWPDPDNLVGMFKAYLDGVVDAGIIDDDKNIELLSPVQRYSKYGEQPHATIVIAALDGGS